VDFFLQIHRSIVDNSFYEEVLTIPKRKIAGFVSQLIIITTITLSFTHTLKIFDSDTGLPAILPVIFPNMEISGKEMISYIDTPIVVNPVFVADFFSLISNTSVTPSDIPDSFVVIDNQNNINLTDNSSIGVLFSKYLLHINFIPFFKASIPYSVFVGEGEKVIFNRQEFREYLNTKKIKIFFNLFIQHLTTFTFKFTTSLVILALALFILNNNRIKKDKAIYKILFYAVTPVALERIIIAVSGVIFDKLWYLSLLISIVIIFRVINYLNEKYTNTNIV
jgi:hypothetical protein